MHLKGFLKKIWPDTFFPWLRHYVLAVIIIGITMFLCSPLSNTLSYHVVSFILLFIVFFLATFMGTGTVLLASTLSALGWNYFFIPPRYTFHIDKTEDILIFGMFFTIALLNGILTTRVRRQEMLVRERELRTNALFQLTKELSKAGGIDEVLAVAREEIENYFQVSPVFLLQDGNNGLAVIGGPQNGGFLSPREYEEVKRVFNLSGKGNPLPERLHSAEYSLFLLTGTRLNPGVVAIKAHEPFRGDQKTFWDTFLAQISNALEREFLGELAQKARILHESDRLYKTLFNSISHELRIPVATIMGASDALLNSPHPGNVQSVLFSEIFTASLRLNRLIENLLNMSRLESGMISVRPDWYEVNDLVNKVTEDLKDELKSFTLEVEIPESMPLVKIDFGLMEQVLYNLLFNSAQYSPVASVITLVAGYERGEVVLQIMDQGPGFPEEAIRNLFNKFFRVDGSKTGGLGLGLSIVKGFVEAHKGSVMVENRKEGGAKFTIRIPTEHRNINNLQPGDYE